MDGRAYVRKITNQQTLRFAVRRKMKHRRSQALMDNYHFLAFKRRIDTVPPSQIRETAEDYRNLIEEDISQGSIVPTVEVQCILSFLEFLDSNVVPKCLSKRERGFYRRTIERMVGHGLLRRVVLEEFDRSESPR